MSLFRCGPTRKVHSAEYLLPLYIGQRRKQHCVIHPFTNFSCSWTRCEMAVFGSGRSLKRNYTGVSGRVMARTNIEQLIATAEFLGPMLPDLVFVGGAVTSILITDSGAGAPRATLDVDAIAEIR